MLYEVITGFPGAVSSSDSYAPASRPRSEWPSAPVGTSSGHVRSRSNSRRCSCPAWFGTTSDTALLSFLPAVFEAAAFLFFAPHFLGITVLEAGIIGVVLGAVRITAYNVCYTKLLRILRVRIQEHELQFFCLLWSHTYIFATLSNRNNRWVAFYIAPFLFCPVFLC